MRMRPREPDCLVWFESAEMDFGATLGRSTYPRFVSLSLSVCACLSVCSFVYLSIFVGVFCFQAALRSTATEPAA